jgi:hypothetical protein
MWRPPPNGTAAHLCLSPLLNWRLGKIKATEGMEFTIQYFGMFDRLLYVEGVEVDELLEALDRARATLKDTRTSADWLRGNNPRLSGYVILDNRGRQVARGYLD